ncbi:MAG: glutaminyl-peptide cyclotransferase [Bacteroidetes bacterium]|nr:glutaminyl-peptide cyclotransferase [Bacteroidota bacterium]
MLVAGCDAVVDVAEDEAATRTASRTAAVLDQTTAPVMTYHVLDKYPHDTEAFTQGLVVDRDTLFEGTGLRGRSSLRRVELATGAVVQQANLASQFFGEGIAVVDDRILQLTWTSGTGFIYDRDSFAVQDTFFYEHEGWGLTYDGEHLIVSDGTPTLRFWDPATLEVHRQVTVRDGGEAVDDLNELEYIGGEVWANVWRTDLVARIDPETGEVLAWVDLSGLLTPEERRSANVLNGIAYDPARDRLFVTGKLWPWLFEIEVFTPPRRRSGDDRTPV